jgi:2-polyprenyl-3-methyl-5-hydroxy-6-metoxy-1,4-benzoquinol methylase
MTDVNICPVCHGTDFVHHLHCTDHSVSHETFSIIRCNTCQLLITSPRPENTQLGKYYLSNKYTSHIKKGKSALDQAYLLARTFTLKWKLSIVKKYVAKTNGTLLDFGCGVGEFIKVAKVKGWESVGVEPSQAARQNADTLISHDILPSLKDLQHQQKKFDAITAWHVLEHVDELSETVEILRSMLNAHGIIFIAVPNYNSWDARHYKEYWAAYDVPRHLWHFNVNSMTQLLKSHTLTVANIIPMRLDAFYISLLSDHYKTGSRPVNGLATALINGTRSNYAARENNDYSSLIFIATR